ncbi:hypothetical protein Ptr902_05373 [Pyrenophora tritici-repentis]|uniref:Uncharacterized protein n=2 Tax=Pyrenophora tritici-repentis TaxID=45151 RepID=A0A2W1EW47_9PLEO|nr:uncharacterized protein PTRG_03010 [Pyrenophora tritici-repentis Pt-1C-BFP]KAA8622907.1 hypothetical protein PtrV1_04213 [Pyrenophora tritici-repentis]EDU45533.1 conserved hypothetical protein [Pyrenophora tritici-repentis Pt-1C-BFP]KAF7451897.1 hypothetical protein A1F99_036740 [Pyrenophora tritici-repentis]KAF7574979.1 hypothetical protein PtrM4_066030 [Pyrenophora tritici-repentis]KAI0589957.1 hypothetical protein Alg215_00080 [Pyrenophora tritici-repentis]
MPAAKVKSRIQFQSRQKPAVPRNNKHHAEPAQSTQQNNVANSPQEAARGSQAYKEQHDRILSLTSKVSAFSFDSDDTTDEEESGHDKEHVTPFAKRRVSTTEECRLSGAFDSLIRAATLERRVSFIASSPNSFYSAVDDDCDPSDSLIIEAHIPDPQEPKKPKLPMVEEVKAEASVSWHQWLVTLFAGRRTIPLHSACQHQAPPATNDSEGITPVGDISSSEQPRLTHEQAIPQVRAVGAKHPSHRPSYRYISPARTTQYTGYAVVAQDEYEPAIVQRGFVVPNSQQQVSLTQRRNKSSNSIFNRDGDTWTVWHRTNPITETDYFKRSRPNNQLLHSQSTANMVRQSG